MKKTLICFFDYNLNGNFLLKGIAFRDKVVARRPRKKRETTFVFLAQTWQHLSTSSEACYVATIGMALY